MFGWLPLLLHLCMLTGRKTHFTKVCHFPAVLADISAFQLDPVSAAARRRDEIFMLIVAKLSTKEDKRLVTRSCQAALP